MKISPKSVTSFFLTVSQSVVRNGGSESAVSGGMVYRFSERSTGFAFAASRVLADIHASLLAERARIRDYVVLADIIDDSVPPDMYSARIETFLHATLPDEGILLSLDAHALLDPYITSVPLPLTSLFSYAGGRIGKEEERAETGPRSIVLSVYADAEGDIISSLLDTLSQADAHDFSHELIPAVNRYRSRRFYREKPAYLETACLQYIRDRFTALSRKTGETVGLRIENDSGDSAAGMIREGLKDCVLVTAAEGSPEFVAHDLNAIPRDIFELSYLAYRCADFLYIDELADFFTYLGKGGDFLRSLGNWLYSSGILSRGTDFRSLNRDLLPLIRDRLGSTCRELDRSLASYMWTLYSSGKLCAGFPLMDAFTALSFEMNDAFLVSCAYHENDSATALYGIESSLRSPEILKAMQQLETAWDLYRTGKTQDSSALVKESLHFFQKERISAGEYRSLTLIALLSLSRQKGADACAYLEYAYENAERMRDSDFMLETRFLMAMVYFRTGNLHVASGSLEAVDGMIASSYAKEREILCLFMKGRVYFEMGEYDNAQDIFQNAAALASLSKLSEFIALCRLWYARSLVHGRRFNQAEEIIVRYLDQVPESWLFLLESAILSGKKLRPSEVTGIGEIPASISDRYSRNTPSGFAFAEDLSSIEGEFREASRLYSFFYPYYVALFSPDQPTMDSVHSLFLEAKRALEADDPFASLYFFLTYSMGTLTGLGDSPETLAGLSRAFKSLQTRTNAITNSAMRETFMQQPVWNGKLWKAAREHKLI